MLDPVFITPSQKQNEPFAPPDCLTSWQRPARERVTEGRAGSPPPQSLQSVSDTLPVTVTVSEIVTETVAVAVAGSSMV